MAVKIRLRRMGRRNLPQYRLVVMDSRARRDGRSIEVLGHYNPIAQPAEFKIKEDRALEWLRKGAKMSDTVKSLLKRQGILEKVTGVKYAVSQPDQEQVSKKVKKRQAKKEALAVKAEETPPADEAEVKQAPPADEAEVKQAPAEAAPQAEEASAEQPTEKDEAAEQSTE